MTGVTSAGLQHLSGLTKLRKLALQYCQALRGQTKADVLAALQAPPDRRLEVLGLRH